MSDPFEEVIAQEHSKMEVEAVAAEEGEERINALLEQAAAFLSDPAAPRDEYYAFVCEKCAPGFSYYGWFVEAQELEKEAKQIRERLGTVPGVL